MFSSDFEVINVLDHQKKLLLHKLANVKNHPYHPFGKLYVMLSLDFAPYFRYPKNPTNAYIAVTIVMPMFNTPNVLPKSFGCFMLFSKAITTPTASRANRTVPK